MGSAIAPVVSGLVGHDVVKNGGKGVANVVGEVTGANAARDAQRAQEAAAKSANATQLYMFNEQRKDLEPWRAAGTSALKDLANDDFKRDFTMDDFQADPGYQFRMSEGMKALERSAAARGGLGSGGTLKALTRYGQDFASNEYTNAYNRFNADRDRRFNRLSSLAGIGQTANSQLGQAGTNYANNVSQTQIGLGNAQAAASIAKGNQMGNLLQTGITGALAFSDERTKTDIAEVSREDIAEMKRHLKPYTYKYKLQEHGEGEFLGVMAQDLEKSKLGRSMIVEDANGFKQIDLHRAVSILLAAVAEG